MKNEHALMVDLTKRFLRVADGSNPAIIIGCCFNVITDVLKQCPDELRYATASYMKQIATAYEEDKNEHTH